MTDTRNQVLIIDINPVHLSDRERALRAIYGNPDKFIGGEMIVLDDLPPRPVDLEMRPKLAAKAQFSRSVQRAPRYEKKQSSALKRLLAK